MARAIDKISISIMVGGTGGSLAAGNESAQEGENGAEERMCEKRRGKDDFDASPSRQPCGVITWLGEHGGGSTGGPSALFSPLLSSPCSLSHTFLVCFVRLARSHLFNFFHRSRYIRNLPRCFHANERSRIAVALASNTRRRRRGRVRSFVNFLERGQRGTIPTESPISAWCMLIYQESLLLFFFSLLLLLSTLLPLLPLLAATSPSSPFVERWTEE